MRVDIVNADDPIVSREGPAELGENKIVPASPFIRWVQGCPQEQIKAVAGPRNHRYRSSLDLPYQPGSR
jgi:hypothetical protein